MMSRGFTHTGVPRFQCWRVRGTLFPRGQSLVTIIHVPCAANEQVQVYSIALSICSGGGRRSFILCHALHSFVAPADSGALMLSETYDWLRYPTYSTVFGINSLRVATFRSMRQGGSPSSTATNHVSRRTFTISLNFVL